MSNVVQRSFTGGELGPSMYARTDHARYATGLRKSRNFMVLRHGALANRPGFKFKNGTKDDGVVRLLRWEFSDTQTYLLEFGDEYIRFYYNGELVLDDMNDPYEVTTPFDVEELSDLKFVQSADVVTIVHPTHGIYELSRADHDDWSLTTKSLGPSLSAPANIVASGTAGSIPYLYFITAVDAETGEESLPGVSNAPVLTVPTDDDPHSVTWDAVAGAGSYNVYAQAPYNDSMMGFVGNVTSESFTNTGIQPDFLSRPPLDRDLFSSENNYPSVVAYIQQRLVVAASNAQPESVWASKSGLYNNFLTSSPLQDDDAITFALTGRKVNRVRHILDIGKMIVMTEAGEWVVNGDSAGIIRPTEINPRQYTHNGSSKIPPVVIDDTAIYVQARGTIIRDLANDLQSQGFKGSDLTVFSPHLFDGYTIVAMDYQQIPHSVVWVVRSDGVLLGLTYVREQGVWGWHRHDTDGLFEDVCVVQEGNEDAVYVVVKRGESRFIERLASRDDSESFFVDSGLTYDGRDWGREVLDAVTVTLSGGVTWEAEESLDLVASANAFTAGDVGNAIFLHYEDDDGEDAYIACVITAYEDEQNITVQPTENVPVAVRNVAIEVWDRAVDEVSGLDHLEGESVSIWADGYVIANPNSSVGGETVVSGAVSLDNPRAHIHVGLPYLSDIETLDLDTPEGPSIKEDRILVGRVGLHVLNTRYPYFSREPVGDSAPLSGMVRADFLEGEDLFTEIDENSVEPRNGFLTANVFSSYDNHGRIFVRNVDPTPMTILSIVALGAAPGGA